MYLISSIWQMASALRGLFRVANVVGKVGARAAKSGVAARTAAKGAARVGSRGARGAARGMRQARRGMKGVRGLRRKAASGITKIGQEAKGIGSAFNTALRDPNSQNVNALIAALKKSKGTLKKLIAGGAAIGAKVVLVKSLIAKTGDDQYKKILASLEDAKRKAEQELSPLAGVLDGIHRPQIDLPNMPPSPNVQPSPAPPPTSNLDKYIPPKRRPKNID